MRRFTDARSFWNSADVCFLLVHMAFPAREWLLRRRLSKLADAIDKGRPSARIGWRTGTVNEHAARLGTELLGRTDLWSAFGPTHILELLGVSGAGLKSFQRVQVEAVVAPVTALAHVLNARQREGLKGITAQMTPDVELLVSPLPAERPIENLRAAFDAATLRARSELAQYGIPVVTDTAHSGLVRYRIPIEEPTRVAAPALDSPIVEPRSGWTKLGSLLRRGKKALADAVNWMTEPNDVLRNFDTRTVRRRLNTDTRKPTRSAMYWLLDASLCGAALGLLGPLGVLSFPLLSAIHISGRHPLARGDELRRAKDDPLVQRFYAANSLVASAVPRGPEVTGTSHFGAETRPEPEIEKPPGVISNPESIALSRPHANNPRPSGKSLNLGG